MIECDGFGFRVGHFKKGPIDSQYKDARRLVSAKVEIAFGLVDRFELSFSTHWLRGETSNDVQARFIRFAAIRVGKLFDGMLEHADLLERLGDLDPDDPAWAASAGANDDCAFSRNLPPKVWNRIDQGGHPITAVREWRGLSVDQLARKAKLPAIRLSAWEQGRAEIEFEQALTLARALGVAVHLLEPETAE